MHVLFLTHYFPPEGNAPASRTYDNCKRWVQSGHDVTVITGVPNVPDGIIYEGYRNKIWQWESKDSIRVLRVWTYIAPNKGVVRRIANYLSFMISSLQGIFVREIDIVVATSPQFFCAVGGYLLSYLKRVPFVMEVRDLWPESIMAVGVLKNRRILRISEWLEIFLYKKAERVVVVTESFKKVISEKGIPERKITVIKNGVDLEFFKPLEKSEEQRKSLGLDGKFIISYIGTLGTAHALDRVLSVAERMKEYENFLFLFVGSGAEKENLFKIKENKSLSNVRFIERQAKKMIPLYYEYSDVCLVPLRRTPLFKTVIPSKIFEIMAMSKPIVQSVDGESRQILEQSKAGLYIEPEDEQALYEAILYLYNNPEEASLMGRNGRLFVEKYFNRDSLAAEYLNTLERIAK